MDLLSLTSRSLRLERRGGQTRNLRAWDAADALLIEQALEVAPVGSRVLIIDDAFGALTLGLADLNPVTLSDNATLLEAVGTNAALNRLPTPTVHSWRSPPAGRFDLVVMRIPRQLDYLAYLLRWVNGVLAEGGQLLAGGMIKHLPARSSATFEELVTTIRVFPAVKKARAVLCTRGGHDLPDWPGHWLGYELELTDSSAITVEALPAVFARGRLDIGTRLLLGHIAKHVARLEPGGRVLDLACGNGILGLRALACRPDLELIFSDVSSQAVASAGHNLERHFPLCNAQGRHLDGVPVEDGHFDLILLNPPFHEGGAVGDHIAMRLFEQAASALAPGGAVLVVGNRHLGYHQSLKRWFRSVEQIDANAKFVVFRAGPQEGGGRNRAAPEYQR